MLPVGSSHAIVAYRKVLATITTVKTAWQAESSWKVLQTRAAHGYLQRAEGPVSTRHVAAQLEFTPEGLITEVARLLAIHQVGYAPAIVTGEALNVSRVDRFFAASDWLSDQAGDITI